MKRLIFLLSIVIIACQSGKEDYEYFDNPATIDRFDLKLMTVDSEDNLVSLLKEEELVTRLFYRSSPHDTTFIADLLFMIQNAEAQEFYEEAKATFGDFSRLASDFGRAFYEIKKLYLDFKEPRIVTTFSGLSNDMIVNDSLVIISMEAFIGPEATFRPQEPDYILKRFAPQNIVPSVIRVLSNQYNRVDFSGDNFVADMVFYGKSLEFSREVLPHIPDSLIIGYTNREMQSAYENQEYIWGHVIDRELLNNTNPAVLAKYFGERPYIAEIGPDCPGRIGQWLGWRVTELYRMNNPEISIPELMQTEDPDIILRGSKYRGQKDGK